MSHPKTITLGELRAELTALLKMRDDTAVYFGAGDLSYKRIKNRGPVDSKETGLMQFEFNQIYTVTVDLDSDKHW